MSREERRAYKRMMKNYDPYAPPASPAQKARIERVQARRTARRSTDEFRFVTGRFLAWSLGGAAAAGLVGFSIAWPAVPLAFLAGLAGAGLWIIVAVGVRFAQQRLSVVT